MRLKMLCVTIRIKRNDELNGKRLHKLLIDFLIQNKIAGSTVWTGVDGFGKRKRSTIHLEGITINMPLIIEIIDEKSKLEPLLASLKRLVNDNGLVTIHEVDVV
jgi:PII-like signaling protein